MKTVDGFRDSKTGKGRFERLYICFAGVKQGFLTGCRQFIGVDGTFLKGLVGGVLLAAVGVDANNGIFPIAYAAAEGESKDSWCWFFKLLKEDLKIKKDYEWTIMSDKQKGLIEAYDMIFPNATHKFCVKHLHNNFSSAGFKGEVNIEQTCSCRKWELIGIPCPHAIAALWMAKKDPLLYVSKWYTVETYMKCYEGSVCPMNGESEWGLTNVGEGPLPPLYGRAPGRPKKLRRRSAE
ncbi:uncharacterized protein [Coffea arabica]|uniref:SWIM-type domain-containing protein n=1 Tax=Coffea arabica TaxID=13443 RepID=A0ABM4UQV6_COFAR